MNKLALYIRRFRVNRGFTVHSPFAYRFIKLVVRERLPYYAFRDIRDPYDRLLYRTAVYFHPSSISAAGPNAAHALKIMQRALPNARVAAPTEAEFHYGDTPHPAPEIQFLSGPHTLPAHTCFLLPAATIAIRRENLPPQSYPVSLP